MKHYANNNNEAYKPARIRGRAYDERKTQPEPSRVPEGEKDPMELSAKLYRDTEPPKGHGVGRMIPMIVFLLFVFGFAVWFWVNPKSDFSESEKRPLAKFPDMSVSSPQEFFEKTSYVLSGDFGKDFETFYADQFPARKLWVGINAYSQKTAGINGADGVYKCKNGYLINKPKYDDNNLNRNLSVVEEFAQTVGNVPTTVLIAPSTGYICDDVLPPFHLPYRDDETFDMISGRLSDKGIGFVDLREDFKTAYADGRQLYYKTDHHWTTEGAYTAYTALCRQLGLEPAARNTFMVERYNGFYGTAYSSSGFWLNEADKLEVWNNPKNTADSVNVMITEGDKTEQFDSMFFYDHLKENDKYPVFIDGNHALTEITNKNAKGGTLLVIKDSFSHCMAPFLAENYSKVVLVDMRYYKLPVSEIVKTINPERVLVLYGIDNLTTDTDLVWLE